MKKWVMFLISSLVVFSLMTAFNIEILVNRIQYFNEMKTTYSSMGMINSMQTELREWCIIPIIKTSILLTLTISILSFNIFVLVNVILGKMPTINISANLAAWKEHRAARKAEKKQQQLEKAQAKVEQLQQEIKKDE